MTGVLQRLVDRAAGRAQSTLRPRISARFEAAPREPPSLDGATASAAAPPTHESTAADIEPRDERDHPNAPPPTAQPAVRSEAASLAPAPLPAQSLSAYEAPPPWRRHGGPPPAAATDRVGERHPPRSENGEAPPQVDRRDERPETTAPSALLPLQVADQEFARHAFEAPIAARPAAPHPPAPSPALGDTSPPPVEPPRPSESPGEPDIHIHIGRIEVRGPQPAEARRREQSRARPSALTGLGDHLAARGGGSKRR